MHASGQFNQCARGNRPWHSYVAFLLAWALLMSPLQAVPPAAGSTIGNQATATYTDSSNTVRTATSNVVLTVVQQVASLTLNSNQTRVESPGGQVVFAHSVTNTGNGSDTFGLTIVQPTSDDFNLNNAAIYADANRDGLPDNSTVISSTGLLTLGQTFYFVVVGTVPGTQTSGQDADVTVTATSTFTPTVTGTNTDTVTVSNNAVIRVTQSMSATTGASPSGPYTVTLTYTNTGNVTATNLTLRDLLPAEFGYVVGSARWSGSGTTALTDAAAGDPAGISYDYNITTPGETRAVIASIASGQSGTLTFQVTVDSGVAPQDLPNTANYTYNDGVSVVGPFNSNTVLFTVTATSTVTISPGTTIASAPQGGTVSFPSTVTNTGTGSETFELTLTGSTFPAGTTFTIVRSDGTTAVLDSNGNGIPDTGPLLANGAITFNVLATLPPGATGGPFTVNVVATAATDPGVSATATNTLTAIASSSVDLTANAAGTLGTGAGPEASPLVTLNGNPGDTVRFTLNVKNNSTNADTFDLAAGATSTLSSALPSGWSVVFRDSSEAVITRTNLLAAAGSQVIFADVTIPGNAGAATQPVYFRAKSPTTNAEDTVYDAVATSSVRSLSLTPNNSGQAFPGGSTVYSHTLTNTGNVLEGDNAASTVSLALANNLTNWSAVVYYDANGNGALEASETAITDLSFVSNGAAGLAPGESIKLLVKVITPPESPSGAVNTTTLTATTANGTYTSTVPAVVSVTDNTTAVFGDIRILKEQALDANGDGTPDTAYSTANISIGAIPGACIRYRVTITNVGSQSALDVILNDVTPTFTVYHATVPAATSAGAITTSPTGGAAGSFRAELGNIAAGASVVFTFGVQIVQ
ncbi:beta strand repeat-containing protein [Oleiharenicola lentus]|uniref:beta strand repeat-containing protein n=1 Tax=Oleiharenicola lentus TaxID=2508720 RepID=UPI003F679CD6